LAFSKHFLATATEASVTRCGVSEHWNTSSSALIHLIGS
jgi:hypothetical protein